jgi:hypothetical protein
MTGAAVAEKPSHGKVRVWVTTPAEVQGDWGYPELEDSAKDFRGKIDKKWTEVAQSIDAADLVVTITNRFYQGTGLYQSSYNPYSRTATAGELNVKIVTMTIEARDGKSLDAYGYHRYYWKSAAGGAAGYVEKFAKQHYAKIVSLRGEN